MSEKTYTLIYTEAYYDDNSMSKYPDYRTETVTGFTKAGLIKFLGHPDRHEINEYRHPRDTQDYCKDIQIFEETPTEFTQDPTFWAAIDESYAQQKAKEDARTAAKAEAERLKKEQAEYAEYLKLQEKFKNEATGNGN